MGGTFDPPHKAHIAMAKAAYKEFSLDKVVFMTGGNPPHKTTQTDARIRNHMIKLGISGYREFEICEYEINKESYSYTSDTLKYLNEKYSEDTFYFIIGGDSLGAIFSWHEPEEILKRCVILVYPREGYPTEDDVKNFNKEHRSDVRILHFPENKISSSDIREEIKKEKDVSKYVDSIVYEYIKRNNLYKERKETNEEHLKKLLKPSRYEHSLGVASVAVSMAEIYGADVKKAYIAGLLHDCAKNLSEEEIRIKCEDLEVELDEFELENPALIHAKLGAEFVKAEFGINDSQICDAIKYHTLSRPKMSKLEKIIFVADMIEPSRDYPEVCFLRKAAFENLDSAVLECVTATIEFNQKKGKPIHPVAYKTRDWLLLEGVEYIKNVNKEGSFFK